MAPNDPDPKSDDELVKECQRELPYGTHAFEKLVRRYEPQVMQTCRRYLSNEQDAEEAMQDVFLRACRALPNFAGKSKFKTWLYRITINVCATKFAKRKKRLERRKKYIESQDSPPTNLPPIRESTPVGGVLGEAFETLAESDREALILRYITGLSVKEISGTLKVGESATKMRLHRAEQRLKEAYLTKKKNS